MAQDSKRASYRPPYTQPLVVSEATPSIRTPCLSEPIVCLLCGSDNQGSTVCLLW